MAGFVERGLQLHSEKESEPEGQRGGVGPPSWATRQRGPGLNPAVPREKC